MRDLAFVGYIAVLMLMAFKRPFLFTLIHRVAAAAELFPAELDSAVAHPVRSRIFGFYDWRQQKNVRIAPRCALLVVLLAYCGYTTTVAAEPVAALEKCGWVWKALVFAAFLPLTLHTKLRLEALALTMVLCASGSCTSACSAYCCCAAQNTASSVPARPHLRD